MGVLVIRAPWSLGSILEPPDFWKLPTDEKPQQQLCRETVSRAVGMGK